MLGTPIAASAARTLTRRPIVKRISLVAWLAVSTWALTPPVRADVGTRVTSGALTVARGGGGQIDLRGQSDFAMHAVVDTASGVLAIVQNCNSSFDCIPGAQE